MERPEINPVDRQFDGSEPIVEQRGESGDFGEHPEGSADEPDEVLVSDQHDRQDTIIEARGPAFDEDDMGEELNDPCTQIVDETLQQVSALATDRAYYQGRLRMKDEELTQLNRTHADMSTISLVRGARNRLSMSFTNADNGIQSAFAEGRRTLAYTMTPQMASTGQRYFGGDENIARIAALSPSGDEPEDPEMREARTAAILGMSSKIVAGQPTLLAYHYASAEHNLPGVQYVAAVPERSGFSAVPVDILSPDVAYALGIDGSASVPVSEAAYIEPAVLDGDMEFDETAVRSAVDIYSGDEVQPFLDEQAQRHIDRAAAARARLATVPAGALHHAARRAYSDATNKLMDVIGAGRSIGMQVNVGERQPEASEYVCDRLLGYASAPQPNPAQLASMAHILRSVYSGGEMDVREYAIATHHKRQDEIVAAGGTRDNVPILRILTAGFRMPRGEAIAKIRNRSGQ